MICGQSLPRSNGRGILIGHADAAGQGELTDEKVFTIKDQALLMRLGVEIISRMFADLYKGQVNTDDDDDDDKVDGLKKN